MIDYRKFNPTHAVIYQGQTILVQNVDDNEFISQEEWNQGLQLTPTFSIPEDEPIPTNKVWIRNDSVDLFCYKDADSPIKLVKICFKCHSQNVRKNGKSGHGFQRWQCQDCKTNTTGNKAGRPTIGDRPMTAKERKRKSRKNKSISWAN